MWRSAQLLSQPRHEGEYRGVSSPVLAVTMARSDYEQVGGERRLSVGRLSVILLSLMLGVGLLREDFKKKKKEMKKIYIYGVKLYGCMG